MSRDVTADAIRLHDRFTHEGLDRRSFMAELTRIASGSAAALALLSSIEARAQARPIVQANDPRIEAGPSQLPGADGASIAGYAASRRVGTRSASVLVVHENRGLNEHIRDVTRRLAVAGFHAFAPDFLSRGGGTPADEDAARAAIGRLDLSQSTADGVAMLRALAARPGGNGKVGVVGFCWGGAMVNRLAVAAEGDLDAGVVFYGPAPAPAEAPRVQAPLLIHLAEKDERVNATALPWVLALRQAGKSVRAINYHGAEHAFHNDTSAARYHPEHARRAWAETLRFFREHLN